MEELAKYQKVERSESHEMEELNIDPVLMRKVRGSSADAVAPCCVFSLVRHQAASGRPHGAKGGHFHRGWARTAPRCHRQQPEHAVRAAP